MRTYSIKTSGQLGPVLKGLRVGRGLTQAELAARIGAPQKAVSAAESRAGKMSVERLVQLLGALEVDLVLHDSPRSDANGGEW